VHLIGLFARRGRGEQSGHDFNFGIVSYRMNAHEIGVTKQKLSGVEQFGRIRPKELEGTLGRAAGKRGAEAE
jgi:hypothetical protein